MKAEKAVLLIAVSLLILDIMILSWYQITENILLTENSGNYVKAQRSEDGQLISGLKKMINIKNQAKLQMRRVNPNSRKTTESYLDTYLRLAHRLTFRVMHSRRIRLSNSILIEHSSGAYR